MQPGERAPQASIRDALDVLFRYKSHVAILTATLVAVTVFYNFFVAAETYRSEARLLIRLGRENVSVDPSVEGGSFTLIQNTTSDVFSEVAILQSRQLAEKVVDTLGVEAFLDRPDKTSSPSSLKTQTPIRSADSSRSESKAEGTGFVDKLDFFSTNTPYQRAVKKFTEHLAVAVERKSNIISVSFDAESPDLAQTALERFLNFYMDHHIKIHAAKAEPDFFEHQTKELKSKLISEETRLDEFRRAYGISSLEKETEELLKQIYDLQGMIDDASSKMKASQSQAAALQREVDEESKTVELSRITGVTNWAADDYKKDLSELRLREMSLAARYSHSYRPLVELRRQIERLEATLATEGETHTQITTGINENRQQLELEIARQRSEFNAEEARLKALTDRLNSYDERHATLTATKIELTQLKRDVAFAEEEYRKYRDKLEESKISVALDKNEVSNVSVVQAPIRPFEPVGPRKLRNIALSILLGLCGSIALAFLLDYFDDSLKKDSDVNKRLDLPVLASISESEFNSCI